MGFLLRRLAAPLTDGTVFHVISGYKAGVGIRKRASISFRKHARCASAAEDLGGGAWVSFFSQPMQGLV